MKLPKLNLHYWILMLICTTMGELIGNLISRNFALGYTQGAILDALVYGIMVLIFIFLNLKNDIFYWLLILVGNIGGTNLADWVTLDPLENDKKWGILKPLQLGTQFGSLAVMASLMVILMIRYGVTKRTRTDGAFSTGLYWVAILLSSTFGTTSGDYITNDTPLGALGGSIFLLVTLLAVYWLMKKGKLSETSAYWAALVLMHPVGATTGNYVSKPIGLNLGNVYTNIALVMIFIGVYISNLSHQSNPAKETL